MITEKGTLVIGLPGHGKTDERNKDFEISPMMVKDSIDAEAYAKGKSEHHAVMYGIASQIVRVGTMGNASETRSIAGLADYLIEHLAEVDLMVLVDARHRLEKKLDDLMPKPESTTAPEAID